jgi:NADPH:quinone reductase-like Zn-dependent oxidoreductase
VLTANIQQHASKWIYVAGAAGGVGHFAAQIAKLYGLKVVGSAGKATSLHLLRELHLDYVIDYSKQDVVTEIMSLTGGKGADLVYDSSYTQSSYTQSAAVVASGGEYIRLGTETKVIRAGAEDMRTVVAMDAIIAQCEAHFGRRVHLLDHPILGPLTAIQWRKLHLVHGRHHQKQLLRLREGTTRQMG